MSLYLDKLENLVQKQSVEVKKKEEKAQQAFGAVLEKHLKKDLETEEIQEIQKHFLENSPFKKDNTLKTIPLKTVYSSSLLLKQVNYLTNQIKVYLKCEWERVKKEAKGEYNEPIFSKYAAEINEAAGGIFKSPYK